MPTPLATVLCIVFVLFLLQISRRQFPEESSAVWIPTIYLLIISSKPLAVWFGFGGVDMEAGSPLDRIALTVLFCLALAVLVRRQFNWTDALRVNPWVALMIGYMFISILWSDTPFSSFKRWIRELVALTMALLIYSEQEPLTALQCIFTRTIYMLIPFSLLLIKYYPHLGIEYGRWSGDLMWIGVASQKNGLAQLCLFAIFFLVWSFIRRQHRGDIAVVWYQTHVEVFLLALTVWIFLGPNHTPAYSATSTIALSVGLTTLIGFIWLKKRGKYLGSGILTPLIILIILYGTLTPFIGKLSIIDVSSVFGRDETLTDRSSIWEFLVPHAMSKPIFGHGFGGFWNDAMRNESSSHAHNGYLDMVLNIGVIGLMMFSAFLISSCRKACKMMADECDYSILWICMLLMAMIHNITESTIVYFSTQFMAVLLFLQYAPRHLLESRT